MEQQSVNGIILTKTKGESLKCIDFYRKCKHYKRIN